MPTPGLSLLGFLDQVAALDYLRNACIPPAPDDATLIAEWQAAKSKLGAPTPNAGQPQLLTIPVAHHKHLQDVVQQPWAAQFFSQVSAYKFELVEIDPLLAFQVHVDDIRSLHHTGGVTATTPMDKLLEVCLPLNLTPEPAQLDYTAQSAMITTPCLNYQLKAQGVFNAEFMGVQIGLSLPLVHVVRHKSRYFLHNGFHRAVGLRRAGITHAPCLVRDVGSYDEVGVGPGSFQPQLLESADPPTLAHFAGGKAHPVQLRGLARVFHVSWAQYVVRTE